MLWLNRPAYLTCGDKNCIVFDLPSGERVRLWICSPARSFGELRVAIDAPKDVLIYRGELLAPLETQPGTGRTESDS